MRKFIIGAIGVTALAGGSLALAVANPLGIAGAQDEPTTTVSPTTAPPTATPPSEGDGAGPKPGRGRPHDRPHALQETLAELVANGTITQAQADAITGTLKAKIEAAGKDGTARPDKPHKPGGPGRHGGSMKRDMIETVASVLGMDADSVKAELKAGKSLAEIAQARGVDPQRLVDAITTKMVERIDQAVAEGKLPAERAAAMKAELGERVSRIVNEKHDGGRN